MVPYLIAKPDSLTVLLWSTISIGNTATQLFRLCLYSWCNQNSNVIAFTKNMQHNWQVIGLNRVK